MRKATRIGVGILMLMLPLAANIGTASASTSVTWTGNGSENLPCSDAAHWVLSPAKGITSATLYVGGTAYTMAQNGLGSFAADSVGAVDASTLVTATYEGANTTAFLKLSHCEQGPPPPPPPA
jgi:hypothetical protein